MEPNEIRLTMAELRDKLGFDADIVSSIPQPQASAPAPIDTTWPVTEPFAYPLP
jgi:hypothetical protein